MTFLFHMTYQQQLITTLLTASNPDSTHIHVVALCHTLMPILSIKSCFFFFILSG